MSDGVVLLGEHAEDVADQVAGMNAAGRRAGGFVGGPNAHEEAAAMAVELFGEAEVIEVD